MGIATDHLGPDEPARSPAADHFLQTAMAAARRCGVTRLADVTGLDRLGLPVWQAVRPAGRSLSVHQGKGSYPTSAKIGALCEAIESHCAEQAPADGPCCEFGVLSALQRAPELGDYCDVRERLPDPNEPIQWCRACDVATGALQYIPHLLVSLDYRSGLPSRLDRTSSGLGAGASEDDALRTALLELAERDAAGDWHRLSRARQAATSLDLAGVPFDWFRWWHDRLSSFEVDLQVFRLESILGLPVFLCLIGAVEEFGRAYRQYSGTAAHGVAEMALFKAMAEAIQSRLTYIAGARDDILPDYYRRHANARRLKGGPPPGKRGWREAAPALATVDRMVERLVALGYPRVVVKRLDDGLDGVAVVKAFVPGLGSLSRTRRLPS